MSIWEKPDAKTKAITDSAEKDKPSYTYPLPLQTPHLTTPDPSQFLQVYGELTIGTIRPWPLQVGHFTEPLPLQVLQIAIAITSFLRLA